MRTGRYFWIRSALALAASSLTAVAAQADVLELDGGKARWIAGGPVTAPPAEVPAIGGPSLPASAVAPATLAQMIAQLPRGTVGSRPSFSPLARPSITSHFGFRNHPILGGRRMHSGIDLSAPMGTPVYATALGVVTGAGWRGSYGILVQLHHADAYETRYGHLSQLAVQAGQIVEPGQLIGYVGSTGRSTGPHLHYEVRRAGSAVDPLPYMRGS